MKSLKSKIFNKQLGFTLLELLVVISIIGILIMLGAAAYSTAQQRGRDAKRRGDMKSFQNVYEQYFAANGGYGTQAQMNAGFVGSAPLDPRHPNPQYNININTAAQTYCVCAQLDQTGSGNSNANCAWANNGTHFCVSNLQ
jgi:prepilin-type N-terminal cleavage/methylation domain-containing protein